MVDAFKKYLSELEPAPANKKFLLAVSGGLDSVVMTELFKLSGYSYSIAHCNFQLRGKESDEDLNFVKNLANKNNVPFFFVTFETEKFCSENKLSIQMGARQLRYNWLEETRQKNNLDYIVTAHHADDAIETFFINLLRGTGLSGLHGIKAKNENTIRPMLHFYRKDIEAYAAENKLKWRVDSSNSSDKYERNKIRHHLLPALEEINPKAKEAIALTIENIGRTEVLMKELVEGIANKYIKVDGERTYIRFNFFKEFTPASVYLYEVIKNAGFNYEQCEQIVESISGQPGKIFLSDTHRIVIDRENLIIEPIAPNNRNETVEVGEQLEELLIYLDKYRFQIIENGTGFKIPTEPQNAALDFNKLSFPLKIRRWQEGDYFYPLGMKQAKKVSDFLIDNKVSIPDKERTYVLVSGEDIAWLIGYRLDERFKVTEGTKNVYLCKSQKINSYE